MAKHQRKRKKKNSHHSSKQPQSMQKLKSSHTSQIDHPRRFNHPYATRSKALPNSWSMTCFNTLKKRKKFRRRLSDSSIICLGIYRKIPPFIDLEGTTEYLRQAMYEKLDG